MNKKYSETFETCMLILEKIDLYIRDFSEENIDEYMYFPFIDEEDIFLYKDIDKDLILSYTRDIFSKTKQTSFKNIEELFYKVISCYILSIKIISDCTLYKPYTFILETLRDFDDLGKISKSLKKNNKDIVKKIMKIELDTIVKCEYFIDKDDIIA
jgi:hypothetical protein